jgi:glycosyltransferase involved in cell wall biosynthesis
MNEEELIEQTIDSVKSYGDVFVFDNFSDDSTKEISERAGASVITVTTGGYESVVYSICRFFINSSYDVLVLIDGDGEVGRNELGEGLRLLADYDGVIGSRNTKKRISERIVAKLFQMKLGVDDVFCGFKILTHNGISDRLLVGTYSTGLLNKSACYLNIPVCVDQRDGTRLGSGWRVQMSIFLGGIRGFLS